MRTYRLVLFSTAALAASTIAAAFTATGSGSHSQLASTTTLLAPYSPGWETVAYAKSWPFALATPSLPPNRKVSAVQADFAHLPPPPPPPPPPVTPPPQPVVVQASSYSASSGQNGNVWAELRQCESGGNYADNTGNGYYGAYQFSLATWESLGYSGLPSNAPPSVQNQAARQLQAMSGWGQWPSCSMQLGLT